MPRDPAKANATFWLPIVLAAYALALVWARDRVPPGLNNDAAEKALMGIRLVEQGRFEVITSAIGNSAETLYLYWVGLLAWLLGPTTLAIQAASWVVALALLATLPLLVRRVAPQAGLPAAVLLPASSVWLFHYARSGLRAIGSALFVVLFLLALDAVERRPGAIRRSLAAGAVLGLGLYTYTSFRVVPAAFAIYAVIRLLAARDARRPLLVSFSAVLAGAAAVSIPNLVFLLERPEEFLLRGSYVLPPAGIPANLAASFLLPLHYLERFRDLSGASFFFDGVSAGLTAAGLSPVHPLVALLCLWGVPVCWRRRREPWVLALFTLWLAGTLTLGPTGPSLTRFLWLLPVYLVVAGAGAGDLCRRFRPARVILPLALLAVALHHGGVYFVRVPSAPGIEEFYSPRNTPLGRRALRLARSGQRVACLLTQQANVVRYLTHAQRGRVEVLEFYHRPFDVAEIGALGRVDALLLEAAPGWQAAAELLSGAWQVSGEPSGFVELRPRAVEGPGAPRGSPR